MSYRDTISPTTNYSNPYDLRFQSHPGIVQRRADAYNGSKDVLESPQKTLEKELLSKLLTKGSRLPIGTFVIIGKVGKYAFLAITLPAYIFCYGIPKWLATRGLSKAQRLYRDFSNRVAEKVSFVAHKSVAALKYLQQVTSPILAFIKTRIEKAEQLFSRMSGRVLSAISSPFQKLGEFLKKVDLRIELNFDILRQAQQKARDLVGRITDAANRMTNNLSEAIAKLARFPAHLLAPLSWLKGADAKISEGLSTLQEMINNRVQRAGDAIGKALSKLDNNLIRLLEKMQNFLDPWISPAAEAFAKVLKKSSEWIDSRLERGREKIRKAVKVVEKMSASLVQFAISHTPQPVISLFAFVAKVVRAPLVLYRGRGKFFAKIKQLNEKFEQGLQILLRGFQKGKELCVQAFCWSLEKGKRGLKKAMGFLALVWAFLKSAMEGAFFLLSLMATWLRVLIKYCLLMLHDTARRLFLSGG